VSGKDCGGEGQFAKLLAVPMVASYEIQAYMRVFNPSFYYRIAKRGVLMSHVSLSEVLRQIPEDILPKAVSLFLRWGSSPKFSIAMTPLDPTIMAQGPREGEDAWCDSFPTFTEQAHAGSHTIHNTLLMGISKSP
jgi:hypothetical protein